MFKRKILIIITVLLFSKMPAQNICGEVMYKEVANYSIFYKTISITKFNNKEVYTKYMHFKKAKKYYSDSYDPEYLAFDDDVLMSSNEETSFIYSTEKSTFFSDYYHKYPMKVKEGYLPWKWKLLGEKKKIGEYDCQNASVWFRGRSYIAWFTTDIPVPFGPLKFKGLPGLILEVYTKEKNWSIKALKVNLKKEKNCSLNFDKKQIEKTISTRNYLKKLDSLAVESFKKYDTRSSKGKANWLPDGCEFCRNGSKLEIWKRYDQYK